MVDTTCAENVESQNQGTEYWKHQTTQLRRLLSTACIICVVMLATASTLFAYNIERQSGSKGQSNSSHPGICSTEQCIFTSANMLANMNSTVDPCDNFYGFACGRFNSRFWETPDLSSFSGLDDLISSQLQDILKQEIVDGQPLYSVLVRNAYKACMDMQAIERLGLDPLLDVVDRLGGWPLVRGKKWRGDKFDWISILKTLREIGYATNYLMTLSITANPVNTTVRIIEISEATRANSMQYLKKTVTSDPRKRYLDWKLKFAIALGAKNSSRLKEEIRAFDEFENQLANITMSKQYKQNLTQFYNPISVKQLSEQFKNIPWLEYFNNLFTETINDDEIVSVDILSYLSKLDALLAKTPKRVVSNYLIWRVICDSIDYLPRKSKKSIVLNIRRKERVDLPESESRWKYCIGEIADSFPSAVGAMYIRKFADSSVLKEVRTMVYDIHSSFLLTLMKNKWMDPETKKSAVEKAAAMKFVVGYPHEILSEETLNNYYKPLDIVPDEFFKNSRKIQKFLVDKSYESLRHIVDRFDWTDFDNAAEVNAAYNPMTNVIEIPYGILGGNFFGFGRPRYVNYASLGWVIGHEITHGFDVTGRQLDKAGNLVDWWDNYTANLYRNKSECFVSQYSNYTMSENGTVDGILTEAENIADNGGLQTAYQSYQNWVDKHGAEPLLNGLNYTQNQLFWIAAANMYCEKLSEDSLAGALTDVHSPSKFRVIGCFSNSEEFNRDFQCQTNNKMNRVDKCVLW